MMRWKLVQIVGFIVLAIGVIIRAGAGMVEGTAVALLGLLVLAVGRVGVWLLADRP